MSLRATNGERGNLAVLYCTIAGLLRRFAPRNDAVINTFVLDRVLTESPMTAVAVGVDLFLPMARDAPVHLDRLRRPPWRGIARFDLPMARLALELPQDDVPPVGEEGVIGNPVESDPMH